MASQTPHFVIFPFMAHGHTLPLLDLSKALSRRRINVTIVSTPANAGSISNYVSSDRNPNISITEIPFPSIAAGLPDGCENTSHLPSMDSYVPFLLATRQLRRPFEDLLASMFDSGTPPACVISDFFFGWTLASCAKFGVPRLVFNGMGVASMAMCKTVLVHAPHKKSSSDLDPLDMPGLELPFPLTTADLPEMLLSAAGDEGDQYVQFLKEAGEGEFNSWGSLVNSFMDLEGSYVPSLESFYADGTKAWCIGPLSLYDKPERKAEKECMVLEWLTTLGTSANVIYVAFGTQVHVSDAQLDELAHGLAESGCGFVVAARSSTWSVPEGVAERTEGKGLFTDQWVDQRGVLSHRAVGGFMSHCGWNSVLESVASGVPILAWPMIAEQSLNAKFVVDGVGAGLGIVERVKSGEVISRGTICERVRELMGGDKGREVRDRAQALGQLASKAVQDGGSSNRTLSHLIAQLSLCN